MVIETTEKYDEGNMLHPKLKMVIVAVLLCSLVIASAFAISVILTSNILHITTNDPADIVLTSNVPNNGAHYNTTPLTFTATLPSSVTTKLGLTVTFYRDAVVIGTGVTDASGVAVYGPYTPPVGAFDYTATCSADLPAP